MNVTLTMEDMIVTITTISMNTNKYLTLSLMVDARRYVQKKWIIYLLLSYASRIYAT